MSSMTTLRSGVRFLPLSLQRFSGRPLLQISKALHKQANMTTRKSISTEESLHKKAKIENQFTKSNGHDTNGNIVDNNGTNTGATLVSDGVKNRPTNGNDDLRIHTSTSIGYTKQCINCSAPANEMVDEGKLPCQLFDVKTTIERRHSSIAKAIEIHYPESPLYIHHGRGQYLYDENNREYLDLMNNVAHVGHCHPTVTEAGVKQMRTLYTNSRFLHNTILDVAEELTNTMPEKLKVCFFVNSGTEANDLAIRLAEQYTKHTDVVTLDHAYHGHSKAVFDISPYKFNKSKDHGQKEHVHVVPSPDVYRGKFQGDRNDEQIGEMYADDAIQIIDNAVGKGRKIAMFIAESMQSCGGQIILPKGYLKKVYQHVRKLGGVCVADEVQVGFGRSGKSGYWAFEQYGVVPDIVTVGKPMGNGHPVACVVTTEEIAKSMEETKVVYFNTYGGNPVSMAITHAVMQVIREENLQENAEEVGQFTLELLRELAQKHELIGDIRGVGLFLGIELVKDKKTKEPATEEAKIVNSRMRQHGILISKDGPHRNVLKAKPPMCITKQDMQHFVAVLDEVLTELQAEIAAKNKEI